MIYKISHLFIPSLWRQEKSYYCSLINVDTGTQKLNDLPKVTPGKQGLEPIYSISINLFPKKASCP